jgi:hypothetical protein
MEIFSSSVSAASREFTFGVKGAPGATGGNGEESAARDSSGASKIGHRTLNLQRLRHPGRVGFASASSFEMGTPRLMQKLTFIEFWSYLVMGNSNFPFVETKRGKLGQV